MWWCAGVLGLSIPHVLLHVDFITARTTLKLWHELYTLHDVEHDFPKIFEPVNGDLFFAFALQDEIRAIARCAASEGGVRVKMIAHPPQDEDSAETLMSCLAREMVSSDETLQHTQPKWYIAHKFFSSEPTND